MASKRHNLSRRAVLGGVVGVCALVPRAQPEPLAEMAQRTGWTRTLATYRRAEARVAAFKAAEALLPPERREWPAVEPLEQRLATLDTRRPAAPAWVAGTGPCGFGGEAGTRGSGSGLGNRGLRNLHLRNL